MYGETPQTSGFIIKEASSTHVIGTLGLMVPHLVVKKNPCSDMKAKEQNVTRLPIPGSLFTRNSRNITLAAQPTNTTSTMSVMANVPAIMNLH